MAFSYARAHAVFSSLSLPLTLCQLSVYLSTTCSFYCTDLRICLSFISMRVTDSGADPTHIFSILHITWLVHASTCVYETMGEAEHAKEKRQSVSTRCNMRLPLYYRATLLPLSGAVSLILL
ncbi:hypothetical protein BDB00DRAFT_822686 [Zychaea mexicana]|uniref:uncharacterized protein n=1 Tax=Zychaea mexicana TaxID=64656 RepID=UPI0022FF30CE|nr:uncharacterized protein BDB00DRAFT_822686 [Zychaea mexicana]KAI9493590.1 hypothetical protein BDB00DRAFT_822686 [Zychaea mexicana]